MKKINVLIAIAAVLVILGGFIAACQVDTAERITVTFEDPSGANATRDVQIVKGTSLGSKMKTPTREGYVFYGWFEGQNQYLSNTPISTDITLSARWADDIATVSFTFTQTTTAGAVIQPTASIPPVTAIKGLALGPLAFPVAPRSKGWEFAGWLLGEDEFTVESIVEGDITLTASWVAKPEWTVTFNTGAGGVVPPGYTSINNSDGTKSFQIKVFANECIDEWEVRFPPKLTSNTVNATAFFVDWFDKENRAYDGRVPIRSNNLLINAKWGLPPKIINLDTEIEIENYEPGSSEGVSFQAEKDTSWDGSRVIVNKRMYDVPENTNRWRILYRLKLLLPSDFDAKFYTRYTVRARFYANRQGAKTWNTEPEYEEGKFQPNTPPDTYGWSEEGLMHGVNPPSRSDDGWGQISWTSVPNWNGQGADAETMLQRYNLDRKGGTINDTWAPLRGLELPYPPYLLIQTSDNYVGHIEVTEIVFHNGEWEHTAYIGEEPPSTGEED